MRVFELLQHLQLIIDHALIPTHIFLQDDLNCDLLTIVCLCLADDTVCARTKGATELVQGPGKHQYILARIYVGGIEAPYFFS